MEVGMVFHVAGEL